MKRFLYALLAIIAITLGGCVEDVGPTVPESGEITLSQSTLYAAAESGTYSIDVTSPYEWRVSAFENWIQIENGRGYAGTSSLTFTVEANPYSSERQGSITIITDDYNLSVVLEVVQSTAIPSDKDVIILNTHSEGADIRVIVPDHVKQQNRRIKWGVTNIAMLEYNGNPSTPDMLHSCDPVYPASLFKNDTILNINHYNVYRRNEKGEIGYYYFAGYDANGVVEVKEVPATDPRVETGEALPIQYYYHFQPGEPLVILMSEVDYAGCSLGNYEDGKDKDHKIATCDQKHPTINWGWGPGWYWYPFDYEAYQSAMGGHDDLPMPGVGGGSSNINPDKFWLDGAWWKKVEVRLPEPAKFAGSVDVKVENVSTDSGTITFTPDDQTYAYFMGIYAERDDYGQGYRELVVNYLDGDESLMQWFTTSEMGSYFGIYPYYKDEGVIKIKLNEYFYTLTPNTIFHIVVNAVGAKLEDGELIPDVSAQNYQHITFKIPNYTLDAPELIVTAEQNYSPYKVKFNIKNPNYASNPVKKVVWTAEDSRIFSSYMNTYGYTYYDMVMMNDGVTNLGTAELAQVNSDFGYDMEFDVRPGSSLRLAAMGWNEESRPSNPDAEGAQAWADATSDVLAPATPLDMSNINALKGDWTATAKVNVYNYNTGETTETEASWKVTIGDLNSDYTLTEEDYAYLAEFGVTKAAADAYLAELNKQSAAFNQTVLEQNRVMCLGWQIDSNRATSTASPWDLFFMSDYNASQVDYLFDDFGPKWFLQVNAKGEIFVPVNYYRVPQMGSWYDGMNHFLVPGSHDDAIANYINPSDWNDVESCSIPVEVKDNTITLKSTTVTAKDENGKSKEVTLYPTVIYEYNNEIYFYNSAYVVSEVTLTKGWSGAEAAPAKFSTARNIINAKYGKKVANSGDFKPTAKTYSRTVLAPQPKKADKVVTNKMPSREEIRKGMEKMMQMRQPSTRK